MAAAAISLVPRCCNFYKIYSEKNPLEKVRRICTEFTKMVRRIGKLHVQNFHFLVAEF